MKRYNLLLLVFALMMLSCITSKNIYTAFVSIPGTVSESRLERGARIRTGDVELENNAWGVKENGGYTHKIFSNEDGTFGWEWSTPAELDGSVKMYLQAIVGHKPFFDYSIGEGFPFTPKELKSMKAQFHYEGSYNGKRNLAFEFWTVDEYHGDNEYVNTRKDGSKNIIGEYMFWMQASYGMPITHENVEIDGREWDVVVDHSEHTYVAFIAKEEINNAMINFKPFMNWLILQDLLQESDKVVSLEFGNEVIEGSGKTLVKDYKVTIEK